jgi:hypothetical protein
MSDLSVNHMPASPIKEMIMTESSHTPVRIALVTGAGNGIDQYSHHDGNDQQYAVWRPRLKAGMRLWRRCRPCFHRCGAGFYPPARPTFSIENPSFD